MLDPSSPRPLPAQWLRRAGDRLAHRWLVKMFGTMGGMTVFFVGYFWVIHHPLHPPAIMPFLAVDRWIGFWPAAVSLYFSLWIYVSLVPALIVDRRELFSYALVASSLGFVGLAIFYFWPTAMPPTPVDWSQHPAFAFLQSVDGSRNVCPSLHVAFAVFSAAWLHRLLRQIGTGHRGLAVNWLWCLGIVWSTMAIRQHVFIDVLAGAALGLAFATVHLQALGEAR